MQAFQHGMRRSVLLHRTKVTSNPACAMRNELVCVYVRAIATPVTSTENLLHSRQLRRNSVASVRISPQGYRRVIASTRGGADLRRYGLFRLNRLHEARPIFVP